MKQTTFLYFISLFVGLQTVHAQSPDCPTDAKEVSYDVILVAGQSNTHYGSPLDITLDTVSSRVYQLARQNRVNYRLENAKPVLDFWTRQTNRNSFSTTFSNLYVNDILKDSERRVLIIPCGYAGSSIANWSKGRNLYTDAMERVNYVLDNIPGSKLVAILWHQGEANVGWSPYQDTLDKMIADMRNDIHQENTQDVPFILGGMVPYWVNSNNNRIKQQQIIKDTPNRVTNTGYADSEFPTVITKPRDNSDAIHFDGAGQREMGQRYYKEFLNLMNDEDKKLIKVASATTVDLTETQNTPKIVIHPNPVSDVMNISSPSKIQAIEIYNQSQTSVFKNRFNDENITIPTANLSTGFHVVVITLENNTVERIKIIKK